MMLVDAHEMGGAPEFRRELHRWVTRLLDPDWHVVLGNDDSMTDRAQVRVCLSQHEATVLCSPTQEIRPGIDACHEVVHIVLRPMHEVACRIIDQLPEAMRSFARQTWDEAHEAVTDEVARQFVRAYASAEAQEGRDNVER
jgi:hypothetical protein